MVLCRPLPIAFPLARHRRCHRIADHDLRQCAVVCATVVFQPSRVVCVLVQVVRANTVVLALDHVAQATKEALNHVGVLAVVAVNLGVVHAVNVVAYVQLIPFDAIQLSEIRL